MAAFFESRSYDFVSKGGTGGVPRDLVLCDDLVIMTTKSINLQSVRQQSAAHGVALTSCIGGAIESLRETLC